MSCERVNMAVAEDEAGPPPLEDMTEYLQKIKDKKIALNPNSRVSKNIPKETECVETKVLCREETCNTGEGNGFGGFQKGFLFSSKPSKSVSKSKNMASVKTSTSKVDTTATSTDNSKMEAMEDDVLRPKQQYSKSSGLELPEVQEAMKTSLNAQNWMTDDLLTKIESDPVLSKAFRDPAMSQALAQFQANPQQALATTKDKPEIQKFLQSFCTLMGEHFTALGEAQEKTAGPPVTEIVSQEEAQMKKILAKPEVRTVLEDPKIRKLIETLKTDPTAAQQVFHSGSADLKRKIKVLIDNGLLATVT